MKSANSLFITLGLAGACAVALLFTDSKQIRQKASDTFQSIAISLSEKPPQPAEPPSIVEALRDARIAASEPIAADVLYRQVRLPAIHEGNNYGWIQLPRGTFVDLLRNEGGTLLIRYDQITVRVPQCAVEEGAVILRKPKAAITRI
ncbi:MAG: hypothetical protein JWL59_2593 [Chthoniobacteraceae bacterium]|nr:hypothetical protein [Chthoniobacteraceae bacterium]